MAVARAAHQGGVNVTVRLSPPDHLSLNGLDGSVRDRACDLLATEEPDLDAEARR